MKKILSSPLFYPSLLILISIFIAYLNYTPGTFLTGWDTLHPEFDFPTNFSRLLSGVWRAEQGLGAVSGHSAMADLPRVFILWLFHFIFPLSFLRYAYIFLCLILGPLGIYFLSKYLIYQLPVTNYQLQNISFISAIFYLFNLGTVQQFYVPFEMFPTAWAFIPWIILSTLQFLSGPSRIRIFYLGFWILFSTPMAYAAHLWYPFFGCYLLFLTIHFYYFRYLKLEIRNYIYLILVILSLNSFWILPNLYYLKTSSWIPQQNQQNRLHSQEFLLKNRQNGNLADSTLIKGFYMDWDIYNFQTKNFQQLMPEWRNHFVNFDVKIIGYLFFVLAGIGLILAFRDKHQVLALSPFFVIPLILLSNTTVPFKYVFDVLLKVPMLAEILRFVFTKLSPLLIFGQTIFLAYFLLNISKYIKTQILTLIFLSCIFIYSFPVFQGLLISSQVKINIPQEYFQLNKYLNSQPHGRILTLPLHNPSGWTYNNWGYQGSGFLWWGIPQSVLDRDSDRWEVANEEAYREFYTSLYSRNANDFAKYLSKYKINYLIWDQSVITTATKNQNQTTFNYEIDKLFTSLIELKIISPPIKLGDIWISNTIQMPGLIQVANDLPNFTPKYQLNFFDNIYQGNDYVTDEKIDSSQIPNRNILSPTNKLDLSKIDFNLSDLPQLNFKAYDIYNQFLNSPNLNYDASDDSLSIYTRDQTHGINLSLDNLPHNRAYIIGIKSNFQTGIPLRFCFKNPITNLCLIEDELSKHTESAWDYFLIPYSDQDSGYEIDLNAISYTGILSFTQIQKIRLFVLPDDYLNFQYQPTNDSTSTNIKTTEHLNHSFIKIALDLTNKSEYLILNQSYNSGWLAFYFDCKGRPLCLPNLLPNHVLINNWSNGWQLPSVDGLPSALTIYIFFWPQLLEFFGLALIPLTYILFTRPKL